MAWLSITNVSSSSFTWDAGGLQNPWNQNYARRMYLSTGSTGNGSTSAPSGIVDTAYAPQPHEWSGYGLRNSRRVTGVSTGRTYYAYLLDNNGYHWLVGSEYVSAPLPNPPSSVTGLSAKTVDYQSVYLSWNPSSGYNVRYNIRLRDVYNNTLGYQTVYNTSYTWSGLTSNTTYRFSVAAIDDYGQTSGYSSYESATTKRRLEPWEWYSSKSSGNSFNLTAREWNDFTDKIDVFRESFGRSDYAFTRAYSGNTFYAYMFNEAKFAIDALSPPTSTGSTKSSGNTVNASDLNRLRNALNSLV